MTKAVSFYNNNDAIVGNFFLPGNYDPSQKLPAVIVTGAWITVKEQMPTNYVKEMTARGFATPVFDFRSWRESSGTIKYYEDPHSKTQDIIAAANFLLTQNFIDIKRIYGLDIFALAGYLSDAANQHSSISGFALVAPWLHDAEIVEAVCGGVEGVSALLARAKQAKQSGAPQYIEAASLTNENALMYKVPYYTDASRGLIPEYDNKFNLLSWSSWLTYDAIQTATQQSKPGLLVHSEAAAITHGAQKYVANAVNHVELIMLPNITQFEFYGQPEAMRVASNAVAEHFNSQLWCLFQ